MDGRKKTPRAPAWFAYARCLLRGVAAMLVASSAQAAESVCAEVRIEIKQTVTLERQAFDAVLKIRNGLSLPVEALDVDLQFADADGVAVPATTNPDGTGDAKFFFRTDGATGIDGDLDGSGIVAPTSSGEAHWLIVPTATAGGRTADGIAYRVGAKITYRMGSETKTVEVTPDTITVKPQPKLKLDYFLTRHVYGDDPMTPATEPVEPFTLGVRVWNDGYGKANAVAIESGQPKIVDNKQGLLVDFRIEAGYVDDAPAQPTLALGFGAIAGGTAKMGRWNMTASLSGQFADFKATIRHADEFGGALTSLIDPADIRTHDLVRDVLADAPGRDGVRDFLAYDNDALRLYESDGGLVAGTTGASNVVEASGTLSGGGNTRELVAASAPNGFIYAKVADPFDGQLAVITARREDGKALPAANAWFSKERDASGERWLYYINLFDYHDAAAGASMRYTLTTGDAPPARTASLEGIVFDDADADGVRDEGEAAMFDVQVTLGGSEARTARTDALGKFAFRNLAAGTYSLASGVVAGYRDGAAVIGSAGGTVQGVAIGGIVLADGLAAGGYGFAKRAGAAPTDKADLSIAFAIQGVGRPEGIAGMTINVYAIVNNLGPTATSVRTRFTLPPGTTIVGGPQDFIQTGIWQLPTMAPLGRSTLSFAIKIPTAGPATVSVDVDPSSDSVVDTVRYNNFASKTFEVLPSPQYDTKIQKQAETQRLLVLAACPPMATGAEDAACLDQRVASFKAMFPENFAVRLRVATNERDFVTEMRSRHWHSYWIDSGAARVLSARAMAELAHAALRREPVIIDRPRGRIGADSTGAELLESYIPVRRSEPAENAPVAANVRFRSGLDNPILPGLFAIGDGYDRYSPATGGEVLGIFETAGGAQVDGGSAPVIRYHGFTVFGFDLMAALQANPQYRSAFLVSLANPSGLASVDIDNRAAGRRVDAVAEIVGYGIGPLPTWVGIRFPSDLVAEEMTLGALPVEGGYAWTRTLQSNIYFSPRVRLRLPTSGSAEQVVRLEVRKDGPTGELVAQKELHLDMLGADRLATDVATELNAFGKPEAVDAITAAMASRTAGRLDEAIGKVIDVSEVAAPWRRGEDTSARLVRIVSLLGDLVEVLYREWYLALPPCTAGKTNAVAAHGVAKVAVNPSTLPPPADLSGACRSPVR